MTATATTAAIASPPRPDPLHVRGIKFALYALGLLFYLQPLSSPAGVIAAVTCAALAMGLARAAHRQQLRVVVAAVGGLGLLLLTALLGDRLLDAQWLAGLLGVKGTFVAVDIVTFGLAAFCLVFLLPRWCRCWPPTVTGWSTGRASFRTGPGRWASTPPRSSPASGRRRRCWRSSSFSATSRCSSW
jgi:hypothetical protein